MPRRKVTGIPPSKRVKPEFQNNFSPLKDRLILSNDADVESNGFDQKYESEQKDKDSSKYLHKKFKKVATLEEASPPNGRIVYDRVRLPSNEEENESSGSDPTPSVSPTSGRYVCPYCKLAWNKPSVLLKHIRAHTNERPYPCHPCGFAFKTKSNLYKHCRSRAHTMKMDETDPSAPPMEECSSSSEEEARIEVSQPNEVKKIYKPKFHKAALMLAEESQKEEPPPVENMDHPILDAFKRHIDYLIKENQEIVDPVNWPKKPRSFKDSPPAPLKNGDTEPKNQSKLALALLRPNSEDLIPDSQPLNLTKQKPERRDSTHAKCSYSTSSEDSFDSLKDSRIEESKKLQSSPGPVLGNTHLVESPYSKKRKLRPLEELPNSPGMILDSPDKNKLNNGWADQKAMRVPEKVVVVTPTLPPRQIPLSPALNPLTSITAFNPLTLPPATVSSAYNGGVVTILHGGKAIPYVPGMPGPNSLATSPPLVPTPESVIRKASNPNPPRPPSPDQASKRPRPGEPPPSVEKKEEPEVGEKKFLRPTSLPLKPGTYTPKRHITLSQVSLVSPETPRPRKSYGQLYLNGHAYTYLGLKCSTKMFFCTLNKPQPIYVPLSPDHNKLSMYSNWKVCLDSYPNPLGLGPCSAMSNYDSRNRSSIYTVANGSRQDVITTHSTYSSKKDQKVVEEKTEASQKTDCSTEEVPKRIKVCDGGFESNEDYIYVRGRGRGRYVCEECGIRCKKPSMLKKHIRTHTDLRPYTCKDCSFSFKTKGNLTKHLKSKAHNKKCMEPSSDQSMDTGEERERESSNENAMDDSEDDDDEDDDEDEDDEETEDEEEGKVIAARSLLSLAEVTPQAAHRQFVSAGLVSGRPRTYPYTLTSTSTDHEMADARQDKESTRDSSMSDSDSDSRSQELGERRLSEASGDSSWPMDLSNKISRAPVISCVGGQASMLEKICATTEKLSVTTPTEGPEDSQLLHAYLTERAVRETLMKQHQVHNHKKFSKGDPHVDEKPASIPVHPQPPELKDIQVKVASAPQVVKEVEVNSNAKESALGILALTTSDAKKFLNILPISPNRKLKAEFMPPSTGPAPSYVSTMEDGRSMCGICNKVFNKQSQLRLHVNIHYFERPFRCESCAVSFRTKGHLQKHQRSLSHLNKVNMNSTFGAATTSNPRPFKCDDCKIAFRIHGHLAKHLRSKMHIMKLECLGKLPFGTYAELERSGMNMNDIDTTDCENSLESLQVLAQKLYEKDPSKLGQWGPGEAPPIQGAGSGVESEDEEELEDEPDKTETKTSSVCHKFETDFEKCPPNPTEDGVR